MKQGVPFFSHMPMWLFLVGDACMHVNMFQEFQWLFGWDLKFFLCLKSNYIFYKLNSLYTQDPLYNLGKWYLQAHMYLNIYVDLQI